MKSLIKVKVTTPQPNQRSMMLRLTPSQSGTWGNCKFYIDEEVESCDWWFINHHTAIKQSESAICNPSNIVFFSSEPFEYHAKGFYDQFARIVLCDRTVKHKSIIYANPLSWWVGTNVNFDDGHGFSPSINYDYDSLSALNPPTSKLDRISIITSTKKYLEGHHKRLAFIDRLLNSPIGHCIDFYGAGHNPIPDKLNALLPYKYHIALENSCIEEYWTEKIADPLLAYCLPFYYGCPNINKFLPSDSYIPIDINSSNVIQTIESVINSNAYVEKQQAISESRTLILNNFNLFELMASIATHKSTFHQICTIHPPFNFKNSLRTRFANKIEKLIGKSF